jgi:type IV fimbrial biogenesis protein FimT
MQYSYLKPAHQDQKNNPSVCQNVPFVCLNRSIIRPSVVNNAPFVCNKGFTLIELIITLTIAGILMAVAAPSMFTFVSSSRLTTQINDLIVDLSLTKSEAIKRNTTTGICVTSDGTSCAAGTSWVSGWRVYYIDPVTSANVTVKRHEALSGSNTLTAPANTLIFASNGALSSGTGQFILCDSQSHKSRVLDVLSTGRPTLSEGTC